MIKAHVDLVTNKRYAVRVVALDPENTTRMSFTRLLQLLRCYRLPSVEESNIAGFMLRKTVEDIRQALQNNGLFVPLANADGTIAVSSISFPAGQEIRVVSIDKRASQRKPFNLSGTLVLLVYTQPVRKRTKKRKQVPVSA